MKKWISLVACLLMLAALAIPAFAAGSVDFSASASQSTVERGENFTISVSISGNTEITNAGVFLEYDSSVFEYVGGACNVSNAFAKDASANGLAFNFTEPVAYSGSVGTLTFGIKSTAKPGVYTISGYASAKNGDDTVPAGGISVRITIPCNHNFGDWTEGNNGHQQVCSVCGEVKTAGHSWNEGKITTQATCTKEGVMTFKCTVCNAEKTEAVPVIDHAWNAGEITTQATCAKEGVKTFTCTVCGTTKTEEIAKTAHVFGNLTAVDDENHKDTCSGCSQEITEPHNWDNGTVTKPATCQAEGVRTYSCPDCGRSKTEVIPVKDHTYNLWTKVDADTHKRVCTVCEKEEIGDHTYTTSWKKDSTSHWYECTACGDKKDLAIHDPGPEATETTAQTCKVCQYIIKPALEHTHEYAQEWTVDETGHWYACSGCEEKGEFAPHDFENACDPDCTICAFVRETVHSYGEEWASDVENHWHACSGCGDIQDLESHIPGTAATETEAQNCTICAYEIAPALRAEEETEAPSETDSTVTIGAMDDVQDGLNQEDHKILWTLLIVGLLAALTGLIMYLRGRRYG